MGRSVVVIGLLAACTASHAVIPTPVGDPSLAGDSINAVELPSLRIEAQRVLSELIAALPADQRAHVDNIALISDNALGDVNAYATCDAGGPFIAVSDGMLVVAANLANTTATDEFFGTQREVAYLDWLEGHSVARPPAAFFAAASQTDARKVHRQHELYDEELAFVLGHELAHHYLGHLACNSEGGVVEDLGQVAADSIPLFNQTEELAADVSGVKNLLSAGAERRGYVWTESGALMVLAAFNRHHPLTARDILFGFERSHPIPQIRAPLVASTAETWHIARGFATP